jgi:hypothetical protein
MLFAAILGSLAVLSSGFDCEKYDSNMGATFDLSEMHR